MSAMINIAHPAVSTKPPIQKYPSEKTKTRNNNNVSQKELPPRDPHSGEFAKGMQKMEKKSELETTTMTMQTEKQTSSMTEIVKTDRNNTTDGVAASNVNSIEQLCNIINDLERSVVDEIQKESKQCGDNSDIPYEDCNYDEIMVMDERYKNQLQPERDYSNDKCQQPIIANGSSTYEDIMSFLASIDNGTLNEILPLPPFPQKVDFNANTIIQDIFTTTATTTTNPKYFEFDPLNNLFTNTFKDDLATARLQLEEKEAAITLLQNELKTERETLCEKLNTLKKRHAAKFESQEKKYQTIVKRHQKFVEQLIAEKTDLTEKCNSLAQRIKEVEIKAQKDLKVCTERHMVELQRAKEHFAAAEKIRRERWLEARTSKIKEMTVKGLEPELRSMVEQHQEEIQEIRSAHMKELQDVELRIIRRSNQQLEQLRLELTDSHEKILTSEKNILWTRYKEKLDEQETLYREERMKFIEELERERKAFVEERIKHSEEKEKILRESHIRLQKELEEMKRQHEIERETIRRNLQNEWTEWMENYKKQQTLKVERIGNRVREECNRERDRQIELAIARIERETQQTKALLQQSYESKIRSLKEKHEAKLQSAADNESTLKEKLSTTEKKLANTDTKLHIVENKLEECTATLSAKDELITKLTMERDSAKGIARQEIEVEKKVLEEKIALLYQELTQSNANKEMLLSQLYSRVKMILTQKMLAIKNVTKELEESKARCEHLERLLDQQRKEYLLKPL